VAAEDGYDPAPPDLYLEGAAAAAAAAAAPGDPRVRAGDVARARAALLRQFSLSTPAGLLGVMYGAGFQKDAVAGFARSVAALAAEGDAFCVWVLGKAGRELGAILRALARRAPARAPAAPPLAVVCVGSVWRSWPLLREAFVRAACAPWGGGGGGGGGGALTAFRLLRLTETSAVGAGWRGAALAGHALPLDAARLTEVLYEHAA